jgi:hypothetical protein
MQVANKWISKPVIQNLYAILVVIFQKLQATGIDTSSPSNRRCRSKETKNRPEPAGFAIGSTMASPVYLYQVKRPNTTIASKPPKIL